MVKRKLGALEKVEADLPNLQDKIRRDPLSYEEDFKSQYRQYESFRDIVMQAPASAPDDSLVSLRDLIDFVSHVASCYPKLTHSFPQDLVALLTSHHEVLEPELREKLVTSLVLLRKKDIVDSPFLLNTLFPILISTPSKALRSLLYQKILTDLRTSNSKTTNHRLNRTFQTALHNLLSSDRSSSKGVWAVRITRELWRRQVWTDGKAVEIMKEAALAENVKVVVGGVGFFLGGDKEREEAAEESDDDEAIDMRRLRHQAGVNKKNRKAQRDLKRATMSVKTKERKKSKPHPLNFSALHLLHDPQGFAETLFSRHLQNSKTKLNLEQKLMVLQLVSRLVGLHKLTIISLYSYFLKYLTPRQASVTSFLASLAQSTHNLVPPDALEPLIQKIANEFVSEASAGPVAAAGLNAIREICVRQPLAMSDTLLQDLVMYRKSKDKSVMMAAKGLLSLYRDVGPDMLRRRDRGRDAVMSAKAGDRKQQRFGEETLGGIEGLELLEQYKADERRKRLEEQGLDPDASDVQDEEADEDDWKAWDVQEDDSDDSGGWIDVASDGDDIDISDSDDDKEGAPSAAKKPKLDTEAPPPTAFSKLATTRILTPADLAKLNELRTSAAVTAALPHNRRKQLAKQAALDARHSDDPLTAEDLEGVSRLGERTSKEERLALRRGERDGEGEERHRGATARRKEKKAEAGKSTTNKDKARKKNFLMTLGKARGKQKRSLRDVGKALKGHVDRQRRGGRRGNK